MSKPFPKALVQRNAKGQLLPGSTLNPTGGRTKLALTIAKQTKGGEELISYALNVWRNKLSDGESPANYSNAERHQAFLWLADRLWGKPKQEVTIEKTSRADKEATQRMLDHLTDDEIDAMERALEGAELRANGVIDV